MRISHTALEDCLRNPQQWYSSTRVASSHPYKMGYERALRLSIYHYHRTSADDARSYLAKMIRRHDFKNPKKVTEIEEGLEAYIMWANSEHIKAAGVQVHIGFSLGFLELRGEVGRVDVTPSGYRAVLLGAAPADWQHQLRMPLIQASVSSEYGRPVDEIEVGFQMLDASHLRTVSYDMAELSRAQRRFRRLGSIIRRISRSTP
jgi:hypothetical protein